VAVIKTGILVMSDKGSRGEREDLSGRRIKQVLSQGFDFQHYEVIPDDKGIIIERLRYLCDVLALDLVLTSGGTGMSPRDVTPEATLEVVEKNVPGIPEAMRFMGMQKTPRAMLSRGVAGIRGNTLIINLPGSAIAVQESLEAILPALEHGLHTLSGSAQDCGRPEK
jgi:molybdopterin adenylyltransferase